MRSARPPGLPVNISIGTQGPRLESHQTNVHQTAMNPSAPLLLIDVDGVISLFGFDQTEPPAGRLTVVDGFPHLISASAGDLLARLARTFECVWCSGWEDRADEHLPLLLGLPRVNLPVTMTAVGSQPISAGLRLNS